MNYGRLVLAAVVATVVDLAYGYVVYGLGLASIFATATGVFRPMDETVAHLPALVGGILLGMLAATFSVCNFYMVCQREIHKDWITRIKYLPFLMSIGIGLSINNTRAVFEALFNKESEFARTPKYHIEGSGDEWVGKKYHQTVAIQPLIELALGLYFTATVFYALANQIYGTLPFLMLFQIGFLYTGLVSIVQQYAGEPGDAELPVSSRIQ